MKYTSPLLKKFISINDTPEHIATNLILKTCEIEEINHRTIAESIIIWYITSCEKHPDADKLSVCQVNCGTKGNYQIICGGSNVAAGLYVPVALPGTHFPKAGITIEPRNMRWIASNGMICSKEEIGINEDMELHSIRSLTEDLEDISDADLGIALKDKFPRLENRVFEVDNKSLTNRPDLTGHFGIATELNAIYWSMIQDIWPKKDKVKNISSNMNHASCITFNKIKEYHTQCTPEHIMHIVENSTKPERKVVCESAGVNAYLLLHLKNIEIHKTSFFSRLEMLDLASNPINNRVDFSNLFMNISGQPIHFFDAEKVKGDIIVRNAHEWEKFTDLFETEHILKSSDIVITDKEKILALAWIVGGLESWITENTKNILVEIANFDAVAVRKTWTRLGLRTDAELRFEKNINPRRTMFCLILFLDELPYYKKDLGNFVIGWLSSFISPTTTTENTKHIEVNMLAMEKAIFGKKVDWFQEKVEIILRDLWFRSGDTWTITIEHGKLVVTPPLRRSPDDINIAEDIYEEVARIYGYDQIENIPLLSDTSYTPYTAYVDAQRKIEEVLVRNIGCNQTESYPRISKKALQEFGQDIQSLYMLQNPVHPESPYMRDDLIYGLLSHTAKNSKFFDSFKIFDIGKIRHKTENRVEKSESIFASDFVNEEMQMGVMLYQKNIDQWDKDPILEAKHIIRTIAKELELGTIDFEKTTVSSFHPKKQSIVKIGDIVIGFIGSIHPLILQSHKIGETSGVVYLSLNITSILESKKHAKEHVYRYETLQDQIVWRDLCFVIDASKDFDTIITAIKNVSEVQDIEVFDVYAGKNLGDNKKSVSIKIKMIWDGTMTTEQINEVMNKAITAAESAGGTLRA